VIKVDLKLGCKGRILLLTIQNLEAKPNKKAISV
jgi:hypothetical protein